MASRRIATFGFAAVLALGLLALLGAMLKDDSDEVRKVGALPVIPVAPIGPGGEACEHAVGLAAPFERVRFHATAVSKPAPPLEVEVRAQSGLVLGRGRGGFIGDGRALEAGVGRVEDTGLVSVCVRNRGRKLAFIWGDAFNHSAQDAVPGVRPTVAPSFAMTNGYRIEDDLALALLSDEPRSLLARLPSMFRHAAAFRPPLVGVWTFWLLLAGLLVGVPAMLVAALRAARRGDDGAASD